MKLAWQIASKQVCRLHFARLISHTQMHIWCQEEITCNEYYFPGHKMQMMDPPGGKWTGQWQTTKALNCARIMNVRRYRRYLLLFEWIRDLKNKRCSVASKWRFSQGWSPWHYTSFGNKKKASSSGHWQKAGIPPPHTHTSLYFYLCENSLRCNVLPSP